jgi:hypothetical protein
MLLLQRVRALDSNVRAVAKEERAAAIETDAISSPYLA